MRGFKWVLGAFLLIAMVSWGFHEIFFAPKGPYQNEASERLLTSPFKDLEGESQSLERWKGQVRVVNFWATWCGPCKEEIPDFVRFKREMEGKSLQVVGIALDDPDAVRAFAKQYQINYPVLLGSGQDQALTAKLGNAVQGVPFTLIVTPDGKMGAARVGRVDYATLNRMVEPFLVR